MDDCYPIEGEDCDIENSAQASTSQEKKSISNSKFSRILKIFSKKKLIPSPNNEELLPNMSLPSPCLNFTNTRSSLGYTLPSLPEFPPNRSLANLNQESSPNICPNDPSYFQTLVSQTGANIEILEESNGNVNEEHNNKIIKACLQHPVHTQVDFMHCLVPDLHQIVNAPYYWGVMDRFEAERLLENRSEGTFLLRDSAQEEFLFSVSFRRYGRSLHARVEQWQHKFSFDSHDLTVFSTSTVTGLIEHYKDPACCMFFEPMLTTPLPRVNVFSLQWLCRSMICSKTTYDGLAELPLPQSLISFLQCYHYKHKVGVRRL